MSFTVYSKMQAYNLLKLCKENIDVTNRGIESGNRYKHFSTVQNWTQDSWDKVEFTMYMYKVRYRFPKKKHGKFYRISMHSALNFARSERPITVTSLFPWLLVCITCLWTVCIKYFWVLCSVKNSHKFFVILYFTMDWLD